jgi:hypothetical protein
MSKSPISSQTKNFNLIVRKTIGHDTRKRHIPDVKKDGNINWKKVKEFRKQSMYSKSN